MSTLRRKEKKTMRDENYYKNEIIKMVQKINRVDILNYIYIVVADILKEGKQCQD